MKNLKNDWFLEGLLDFEYKKYQLLAYLQHVSQEFASWRLYPSFSELIHHYQNLHQFKEDKRRLSENFPQTLTRADLRDLELTYEPDIEDPEEIQEIESLVDYALPVMKVRLGEGRELYEYIDEQLVIEPIGVVPLYRLEGYMLMRQGEVREVKAYHYRIAFFENTAGNYHGISLKPVAKFPYSLASTYESIKMELTRQRREMPNPATYLLYVPQIFPEESTLLPVAKRRMLAYLK